MLMLGKVVESPSILEWTKNNDYLPSSNFEMA